MPSDAACTDPDLPAIDHRLVVPEIRFEIYDGELVHVLPSDPSHATRHLQLSALIEAHTGPEFEAAVDLLTRTSTIDDVAPDISVYPDAPHPRTGGRQLEHLAFEVVSTETLGHAGDKAAKLVARGVRRVFAIDIERSRALEWSAELGTWKLLDARDRIHDRALAVPLPIDTLIRSIKTDDAVIRALDAKGNRVLAEIRAKARAEGRAEGMAEALLAMLEARGVALDDADRARIRGEQDPATFRRWATRAATCASVVELFGEPCR